MTNQTPNVADTLSPAKMRILKAVASLLEDGGNKITINRIAHQCAVTEAALYRHYRSKEEIFTALLAYMETHFMSPLGHVQKPDVISSVDQRLAYIYRSYMHFLDGHPGLARLFLGQGNTEAIGINDRVQLLNTKIRSQVAQILKWGQANEGLNSDLSPEQITELFYGLIVGAAMALVLDLPRIEDDARWQAFHKSVFMPNRVAEAS